ncbi:hypothetical protein QN277_015068 [Acacia crassicarpa]|uniref:Uncharacterized protein n=1 Tax=Acacia crassicarpa TaxID=499986 RepID=A0AAE1JZ07_9FABA|nr:hypothetical protein QN277_015068 [Acacia crassicarpa]
MATSYMALAVNCGISQRRPAAVPDRFGHPRNALSSVFKPMWRGFQGPILETIKETGANLLEAFADSTFEFVDQPLLPSQSNFAPVEELGEAVAITSIEGQVPDGFPDGVYIRNGANPLFGGLKSAKSVFGRSTDIWVEGEGMLHALYFRKQSDGSRTMLYNRKYVETDTLALETKRNKRSFLPAADGDSLAVLSSFLLNSLRFGKANKVFSNTNVFEHAGKFYSVAENDIPQEIDIFTLKTIRNWNVGGAWSRPFHSHPKIAPGTGELVTCGISPTKPYNEVGIISADGSRMIHKVDIKLERCSICHEMGVTQRYNVIMDFPLTLDIKRVLRGGPLIKYEKEEYARIGVMPRYGDADSIKWFRVKDNFTFHIFNSFEDGDEVVLWGCSALGAVFPEPEDGWNTFNFPRCYEWRLNMQSGKVKERPLTGEQHVMDFSMINAKFTGLKNRFGYAQAVDLTASSTSGKLKYGGIAKIYFEEPSAQVSTSDEKLEEAVRVEYHMFEENVYCTGAAFVPKDGGLEEDDGWIITFVHNEDTDMSQVHIIDAQDFSGKASAIITMPCRVPYGFHGAFMPISF